MTKTEIANLPEGTRVSAPNYKTDNREMQDGTIIDNLSVMYFVEFDNGQTDYVYKAESVKVLAG